MNRSPLFYPMNRGMDADAGGAAELQTDVMRFMAIISLCLVAIFALVQSIPLAPTTLVKDTPESKEVPEPIIESPEPAEAVPQDFTLTRPDPVAQPAKVAPVALERPAPTPMKPVDRMEPEAELPVAGTPPQPQSTKTTPSRRGFTLRFESDAVLTRLVENETVGLYVIAENQARRLQIESGRISYWSSSSPDQIHEMDPATVPTSFVSTWNRQHGGTGITEKWGVSLPPAMSRQVRDHVADNDGGALIIGNNGQVRLE